MDGTHGAWRAVRLKPEAPLELYDPQADPYEERDVAAKNSDVVAKRSPGGLAGHTTTMAGDVANPRQPRA